MLEPSPVTLDLLHEQVQSLGRAVRRAGCVLREDLGSPPGQGRAEALKVSAEVRHHEDAHGLGPKALAAMRRRIGPDQLVDVLAFVKPSNALERRRAAAHPDPAHVNFLGAAH